MIGRTVSHYRILEKLGEGGMGVVYKGEDLVLHRLVALKFPSDAMVGEEDTRKRFLREARTAAGLLHPNVTVIHEIGEHEGSPFIVMEFVDGHTLRKTLREQGALPVQLVVSLALQLCEGLKAVHDHQILHRDIKAENILVTPKEQVKIADCGLAARFISAEHLEDKVGMSGTTAYMSPERLRGETLDQRSDLWSIGVVLYEMLTGHLPFEADHPDALTYLILNTDPPPMTTYQPETPAALTNIVTKALEKFQENRYQRVEDIIDDLRNIR